MNVPTGISTHFSSWNTHDPPQTGGVRFPLSHSSWQLLRRTRLNQSINIQPVHTHVHVCGGGPRSKRGNVSRVTCRIHRTVGRFVTGIIPWHVPLTSLLTSHKAPLPYGARKIINAFTKAILHLPSASRIQHTTQKLAFANFPYFERIKAGLWYHLAVCMSLYPLYQLFNAGTSIYQTRYMSLYQSPPHWLTT